MRLSQRTGFRQIGELFANVLLHAVLMSVERLIAAVNPERLHRFAEQDFCKENISAQRAFAKASARSRHPKVITHTSKVLSRSISGRPAFAFGEPFDLSPADSRAARHDALGIDRVQLVAADRKLFAVSLPAGFALGGRKAKRQLGL